MCGSPRRIGDTEARDAAWSHDGKTLAYTNVELFLAKADGTGSHQVATLNDARYVAFPTWSPDGTHLRFTDRNNNNTAQSLWEVSADGTGLHPLLPGSTIRLPSVAGRGRPTESISYSGPIV